MVDVIEGVFIHQPKVHPFSFQFIVFLWPDRISEVDPFREGVESVRSLDSALLNSVIDSVLDCHFRRYVEHGRSFTFKKLFQIELLLKRVSFVTVEVVGKQKLAENSK
jgi:hypothetical protein